MTFRIHIERLVVDEGVLATRDREAFQAALAEELSALRDIGAVLEPKRVGAVRTLARQAASLIRDRLPPSAGLGPPRAPTPGVPR